MSRIYILPFVFLLQRQWPTRAKSGGRTSHLVSTYVHADLRVRTFGPASAHSLTSIYKYMCEGVFMCMKNMDGVMKFICDEVLCQENVLYLQLEIKMSESDEELTYPA